jgi:hypothetical protein
MYGSVGYVGFSFASPEGSFDRARLALGWRSRVKTAMEVSKEGE